MGLSKNRLVELREALTSERVTYMRFNKEDDEVADELPPVPGSDILDPIDDEELDEEDESDDDDDEEDDEEDDDEDEFDDYGSK